MKKIVALLLCLLMACSTCIAVFAADNSTAAKVEKSEYHRGDSFTVVASVKDVPKATALNAVLTYDKDVYELVSGEWAALSGVLMSDVDVVNGGAVLAFRSASDVADGDVLTLQFRVKDDAALNVQKDIAVDIQFANSDEDIDAAPSNATAASIKIVCAHNWEKVDTVAPTCGEDGYTNYTCSICGETKKDDVVPATGEHTVGSVLNNEQVPPTCTTPGKSPYICAVCGKRIENEQPALGHDEVVLKDECVEPTYTSEGKTVYICTRCETKREEVLPKKTVEVISVADGKEIAKNDVTVIERDGKLYIVAPEVEGYTAVTKEIEVKIVDGVIAPVTFEYTPNPVDPGDANKPADDNKGDNKPATGDKNPPMGDNMIFVVIALAVVACASAAVLVIRRRKTER